MLRLQAGCAVQGTAVGELGMAALWDINSWPSRQPLWQVALLWSLLPMFCCPEQP